MTKSGAREPKPDLRLDADVPRQTVLLVEGNPSGHRLYYLALLVSAANATGAKVFVCTSQAAVASKEWHVHLGALEGLFVTSIVQATNVSAIAAISHSLGADITVVPDGDTLAIELGRRSKWRGRGVLNLLIMRERAQGTSGPAREIRSFVKRALVRRARRIDSVHVLILRSASSALADEHSAIDPITISADLADAENLRKSWGLDGATYWFSVLGAITARKNVPLIIASLQAAGMTNVGLLVAGKGDLLADAEISELIQAVEPTGLRVVRINRTLTDRELDAAVIASDCLVLAHSNEGPSGLLGKATSTGTRLVTSGATSLRRDAQNLSGLATWARLDVRHLSVALSEARFKPKVGTLPILAGAEQFTTALLAE